MEDLKQILGGFKLCQCLNCNNVMVDKNPSEESKEYELPKGVLDMIWDNDDFAWVCPTCFVDDHLIDL